MINTISNLLLMSISVIVLIVTLSTAAYLLWDLWRNEHE